MSEWKEYKLNDLVSKLGDGLHGTPKYHPDGEYYFINGSNLVNGKIIVNEKTKRVNAKEFEKYKKELNDRTIFVSINGTLGNIATYKHEKVILGKSACYFNVKQGINKNFIKYVASGMPFQQYITENATGTTIKNVPLKAIRYFTFKLPPLPTQTAIAEILSSLDDKIELNNAINKNLEDLAQTLFKRWFVDFEFPDENGQPYKSSGGEMMESELGMIPKGWRVCNLQNISEIKLGGTPSRSNVDYWNGVIPWVNSGEINKNYIINGVEYITELGLERSSTKLIPSKSTLIAITGATMGQVSYSFIDACYNQSVVSLTANDPHKEYCHFFVIHHIANIIKNQTGGAQQHINKGDVEKSMIYLPLDNMAILFHENVKEFLNTIKLNLEEMHSLTQIKDTLLPKLISGELDIKDGESYIESAI